MTSGFSGQIAEDAMYLGDNFVDRCFGCVRDATLNARREPLASAGAYAMTGGR